MWKKSHLKKTVDVGDGVQQGAPEVDTHSAGDPLPGPWIFQLLLVSLNPMRKAVVNTGFVETLMSALRLLSPTTSTGQLTLIY